MRFVPATASESIFCISYLSACCDKTLDKSNLRGGCLRFQSVMAGKSQKWDLEGVSHVTSESGVERTECTRASAQPDLQSMILSPRAWAHSQ